jgi:8-oxo-dGTP diphosphatase
MTTVVAAVIEQEQKILICQRKAEGAHAGKWEFPGGKVEAGESLEGALIRELQEELGIAAEVGPEMARYGFAYPGKPQILLVFLGVTEFSGEIQNRIFQQMEWAERKMLPSYDFLEGDEKFIRLLTSTE